MKIKSCLFTHLDRESSDQFYKAQVPQEESHPVFSREVGFVRHYSATQHQLQQGSLQANFCLTLEVVKKALSYSL